MEFRWKGKNCSQHHSNISPSPQEGNSFGWWQQNLFRFIFDYIYCPQLSKIRLVSRGDSFPHTNSLFLSIPQHLFIVILTPSAITSSFTLLPSLRPSSPSLLLSPNSTPRLSNLIFLASTNFHCQHFTDIHKQQ